MMKPVLLLLFSFILCAQDLPLCDLTSEPLETGLTARSATICKVENGWQIDYPAWKPGEEEWPAIILDSGKGLLEGDWLQRKYLTFTIFNPGETFTIELRIDDANGDITNTNSGFIGVKDVYEFELNSFLISWNDVPWQNGIIDVSSSQELPYCSETNETEKETCPINLDLQGTISNLQAVPSSNCGNESSTASIYYNILLGCIANDNGEETDWNKLACKAIGKVISTTANKTLGGDYIGDIDMKVMFFESNTTSDKDSSYFKIPVSLDRWVKNLSLIFGYTQDQSDNPTYDQSLQFGVNYTLPVFQEDEYSHENHLSPTLYLNGMLNSKQYLTSTGAGSNDRLEKNIGINYVYRFWNPCLLGIGRCEAIESPSKQKEDSK
jgi:hypothetical protein